MEHKADIEADLRSNAVLAGTEATTETAATKNPAGSAAELFGFFFRCGGLCFIFETCFTFLGRLSGVQALGMSVVISAMIVRALNAVGIEGAPLSHLALCFYSLCFNGLSSIFRALQMGALLFAVIVRAVVMMRTYYASPQLPPVSLAQQHAVDLKLQEIPQLLIAFFFLVVFVTCSCIVTSCVLYFGSEELLLEVVAVVASAAVCSDTFELLRIDAWWTQPVKIVTLLPAEPESEKLLQRVVEGRPEELV
ncbi:hypothetical protein HDU81_001059 [Chytriomyces hyalinus]|nr:hypothetical protein HDU81_001059 [Chytriomyces hyalinus]